MDKRAGKKRIIHMTNQVNTPKLLDDLFDRFHHCKISEGRTSNTLRSYVENYRFFKSYLSQHSIEPTIDSLNQSVFRNYIVWMLNDKIRFEQHRFKLDKEKTIGLSPTTVNIRIKFLRSFVRFLLDEKFIDDNPLVNIKRVDENDVGIIILSKEQLKKLLATPDQRTYCGYRDFVLMNVLLDAFLRINEALSLKTTDIDFQANMIAVRAETSKSRRFRTLPITKRTTQLIRDLIQASNPFDSDFIFLSNYGEKLEAGQFRHRLKEYVKESGLLVNVHPHLFRHTAATMFLEAGGDLRHLQMILGHRDLRMVIRYTHLSSHSLKRQHELYTPLNEIVGKLNKARMNININHST
ncbi:integrase [Cohnella kolymensis]|uniref:Integrase n=1 Tax=Cohnella kolymensis TaxID=1590652 RepID=A0ABR5A5A9_9BACL|nr:tyrosine-type recombinase/integrase [Cohnella kolymensis]KIL36208.1 integrase [Cohnella kolymensis]